MKKYITTILAIIFIPSIVFGLSSTIYRYGDNFGIGTTTPQGIFHISSDAPKVYITDTGDYEHFLLSSDGGDFNISSTSDDFLNETSFLEIGAEGILTLGSGITDMIVVDESDITLGSGSESMRIDNNGNVGIGTTTPQGLLHINGDAPKVYLTDTGDYKHFLLYSDEGDFNISSTSDDFLNETNFLKIGAEGILTLGSGITDMMVIDETNITLGSGSESMRIDSNGNVGIGTTTPSQKLDVAGNVRADDYLEYSRPIPKGEALPIIMNMKNKEDGTLDHKSFPSFTSKEIEISEVKDKEGKVVKEAKIITKESVSLSSQIKYLIKGMQEQQETIEELKIRIEELESSKKVMGVGDSCSPCEDLNWRQEFINWIKSYPLDN